MAIMAFMAELWLVGYSIAFVFYGGALIREVYLNFQGWVEEKGFEGCGVGVGWGGRGKGSGLGW